MEVSLVVFVLVIVKGNLLKMLVPSTSLLSDAVACEFSSLSVF